MTVRNISCMPEVTLTWPVADVTYSFVTYSYNVTGYDTKRMAQVMPTWYATSDRGYTRVTLT